MYAVVEIQGSQYKAQKGSVLTVNRIASEKGDVIEFDTVLMLRDEKDVKIGEPYVSGAKVKGVVEDHVSGDKVLVFKYKKRKRYKRTRGHRAKYSLVRVEEITG
ncbi:MAG: 50S ribosomal protein L21 [Spirochaetales bacterium]|nr:MAG: 50S ribosomal protein L21 [Spirochaetales bacterium]